MTSVRDAIGRRIVSTSTAEDLGTLHDVVLDPESHSVTALQVGKGRKARFVAWDAVTGFGEDAIMIRSDDDVLEAGDDRQKLYASGDVSVMGARLLDDSGMIQGVVTDVDIRTDDGDVISLVGAPDKKIGGTVATAYDGVQLRGVGTWAVVVLGDARPANA
jgi:uncharacterized protein YrrD